MEQVKSKGEFEVLIKDVLIEDRVRVDMGDIDSMALTLQIQGQLDAIIVSEAPNKKWHLVEGERRILAAKRLGWTKLRADNFGTLSEIQRKEIEIIMCVQRKQLTYPEEARAVRDLLDKRRKEAQRGVTALGATIKNKDVAQELNMTEARMSENLRLAEALDDHPELEALGLSRAECIKRVRRRDYYVPQGGVLQKQYEENFILQTPLGCLESVEGKIIDLAILHPDKVDLKLLEGVIARLKLAGQIIIFCEHSDIPKWTELLENRDFHVGDQPYIWHIKNEGIYQMFIWAGKHMAGPIRPMPMMQNADRPHNALSNKAKPLIIINQIIKSCSERAAFVVVPDCEDIDTVRCCVETARNVRAACSNKVMRDKLIMSVVRD